MQPTADGSMNFSKSRVEGHCLLLLLASAYPSTAYWRMGVDTTRNSRRKASHNERLDVFNWLSFITDIDSLCPPATEAIEIHITAYDQRSISCLMTGPIMRLIRNSPYCTYTDVLVLYDRKIMYCSGK